MVGCNDWQKGTASISLLEADPGEWLMDLWGDLLELFDQSWMRIVVFLRV